jgi:hypothetical protein
MLYAADERSDSIRPIRAAASTPQSFCDHGRLLGAAIWTAGDSLSAASARRGAP